ncbi:MAG: hypothetical protein IPK96_21650 [Flammeovirgaceae bacterium]|nr:hypothetical protein [Flammeovirgaceae bacterium]
MEELFSTASGKNLEALFDFYLRTTNKLEFTIKQTEDEKYKITLTNFDEALPVQLSVDGVLSKQLISKEGVIVTGKTWPILDPNVYYLKKVVLE